MYLPLEEVRLRTQKITTAASDVGSHSLLLCSIPSMLYLTGSVFKGYIYLTHGQDPLFFVERPTTLLKGYSPERIHPIRKPEQIPDLLTDYGLAIDEGTAIELGQLSAALCNRLRRLSTTHTVSSTDATGLLRAVRSIKTDYEVAQIRQAAQKHMDVYRTAPDLYREGMTELEWQIAIEGEMRRRGSIGLFRAFGDGIEIFMGNVTYGPNADMPAPYDFTMGGAGVPAMPMGATGQVIEEGYPVMLDVAGNFGTHQTDITRVYVRGGRLLDATAERAHRLAMAMLRHFESCAKPGLPVASIYHDFTAMAEEQELGDHFMGESHPVRFVGHGVGIEINELPVITPRWQGSFEPNMVLAVEPKFVLSTVGAVGVENTYLITSDGAVNLTPLEEDVIPIGIRNN